MKDTPFNYFFVILSPTAFILSPSMLLSNYKQHMSLQGQFLQDDFTWRPRWLSYDYLLLGYQNFKDILLEKLMYLSSKTLQHCHHGSLVTLTIFIPQTLCA